MQIEYSVGYIRPLVKSASDALISNELHSPLNTRAIYEALNASLLADEWQTLKHSLMPLGKQSSGVWHFDERDTAAVNLTDRVAFVPIYPDVAYQFRVRLLNRAGISGPSPLAPGLNEEEQKQCLLKPQVPTVNPEELVLYGNVPNTLTVTWKVGYKFIIYLDKL